MSCQGLHDSVLQFGDRRMSTTHKHTVYSLIILYLFRGTDQSAMIKFLREHSIPFRLKDWARTIPSNGVLLKLCKVYCYAKVNGKNKTAARVPLSEEDRTACDIAVQSTAVRKLLTSLYIDDELPVVNHENLDKVAYAALSSPELVSYLDYYVYSKLRFLSQFYGQSKSDMRSDLMAAALLAIYKAYPRYKNLGVLLAISKTAIKNRGTNIIMEHTTQARNTIIGERGKDQRLNVLSLDFVYNSDSDNAHTMLEPSVPDSNFQDSTEWQASTGVAAIRSSRNLTLSEKSFCLVIMGLPDDKFSAYIGEDNEAASTTMPQSRYIRKAASFFSIHNPDEVLNKALAEIE